MSHLNYHTIKHATGQVKFLSSWRKHRWEFVRLQKNFTYEVLGVKHGPQARDEVKCANCGTVIVTVPGSLNFTPKRGCPNGNFF